MTNHNVNDPHRQRLIPLDHYLTDEVSIVKGFGTYSDNQTSELAFFKNGQWVTDIIPDFVDWADDYAGNTRVYSYVPDIQIDRFLENYRA